MTIDAPPFVPVSLQTSGWPRHLHEFKIKAMIKQMSPKQCPGFTSVLAVLEARFLLGLLMYPFQRFGGVPGVWCIDSPLVWLVTVVVIIITITITIAIAFTVIGTITMIGTITITTVPLSLSLSLLPSLSSSSSLSLSSSWASSLSSFSSFVFRLSAVYGRLLGRHSKRVHEMRLPDLAGFCVHSFLSFGCLKHAWSAVKPVHGCFYGKHCFSNLCFSCTLVVPSFSPPVSLKFVFDSMASLKRSKVFCQKPLVWDD